MSGDSALCDDGWNEQARDETPMQRLDRNWADLLQELRVVQTGVQLLTGFLLTLPFQARFGAAQRVRADDLPDHGGPGGCRHRVPHRPGQPAPHTVPPARPR